MFKINYANLNGAQQTFDYRFNDTPKNIETYFLSNKNKYHENSKINLLIRQFTYTYSLTPECMQAYPQF